MPGLFLTKAQVIASKPKFDRVAHGGSSDDFHARAVAEAHLEKAAAEVAISSNSENAAAAPNAELI